MKIAQSSVNMVSNHKYYEENTVTFETATLTRESFMDSLKNQESKMDKLELSETDGSGTMGSENYNQLKPTKSEYLSTYESTLENQLAEIRSTLLSRILSLLQILGGDDQNSRYKEVLSRTSNMLTSNSFVKVTTFTQTHYEEEEVTFAGQGTAMTEDGRVIDFNVDFTMSRRLAQLAGISMASAVGLIDPLVINVDSGVTHINDQHFFFDLDCDGKEDKISNLGSGSGFLAYDKNGDGKIGDGSELFGTRSGNGFNELAAYDSDNNGWIDENDEIFEKLSVWIRNEDGTDTLLSLKEADVGAINLGSADTQFTHYNGDFLVSAMTRATGMFLKESGGVGTIQQVDLAAI